eukprot:TRINITY_DN822_c0_g1_i4.p2 TRINITY_DN822_c0_g1~~TRINITY_DN822_c0_g1_i4.p2  ORF type:complete len:145 (+),score=13.25 TRINITY_DN822_c0_g1_i4:189-623(+)
MESTLTSSGASALVVMRKTTRVVAATKGNANLPELPLRLANLPTPSAPLTFSAGKPLCVTGFSSFRRASTGTLIRRSRSHRRRRLPPPSRCTEVSFDLKRDSIRSNSFLGSAKEDAVARGRARIRALGQPRAHVGAAVASKASF